MVPCYYPVTLKWKYRARQSLYCRRPKVLWSSLPMLTSTLCYILSSVSKCIFLSFSFAELGSPKGQVSRSLSIGVLLVSLLLEHPLLTRNQKTVLTEEEATGKNIFSTISFVFLFSKCKVLQCIEWYLYWVIASMSRSLIAVSKNISKTLNTLVTPCLMIQIILNGSINMKCN